MLGAVDGGGLFACLMRGKVRQVHTGSILVGVMIDRGID